MEGIFNSKMVYGITVWGRVWQIPGSLDVDLNNRTSPSITKEDVRKLQVLQNKCLRMITNSDYKTPTSVLLSKTNSLSVHQKMAHLTLSQVFSIYKNKLPAYHHARLFGNPHSDLGTRSTHNYSANRVEFRLSLATSNFWSEQSECAALGLQE